MWRRVWIFERKGKKRTMYYLRWYGDDGRMKTKVASISRRSAEDRRRELELKLNMGEYSETVDVRFTEVLREDLELIEGQLAPATVAGYGRQLQNFAEKAGDKHLHTITVADCERYFSKRLKEVRPATANSDLRCLKAAFERALKRGYLKVNPWKQIRPVREPERELRVLSTEEVGKLIDACPTLQWKAFVFTALTTGLRSGELCWLEWDDIDFDAGILTVRNKDEHRTKSARNRALALVPSALEVLGRLRLKKAGRWVFQTREGNRFGSNYRRDFNEIVTKAGIKRCTVHDLRRTFISHLAMAGVNEAVVQKLAGHASIETTLKHYTRILPEAAWRAPLQLPWANGSIFVSNSYQIGEDGGMQETA